MYSHPDSDCVCLFLATWWEKMTLTLVPVWNCLMGNVIPEHNQLFDVCSFTAVAAVFFFSFEPSENTETVVKQIWGKSVRRPHKTVINQTLILPQILYCYHAFVASHFPAAGLRQACSIMIVSSVLVFNFDTPPLKHTPKKAYYSPNAALSKVTVYE